MASLMEFCPPGETGTAMFRASFISRLPPSLQIHLSGTEMGNIKELTQTADCLWLFHSPQPVAAVQIQPEREEEWWESVGAITWKGRGPPARSQKRAAWQTSKVVARLERSSREAATRGTTRRPTTPTSGCASGTPDRAPRLLLWRQGEVHLLGKLGGREAVSAAVSYGPKGHLALLVDEATQDRFLVDTGSAFSIIPVQSSEVPTGPRICAADCTPIAC